MSASAPNSAPATSRRAPWGKFLSLVIILAAVALGWFVLRTTKRHPRTDDATVRANMVGIVPRVSGQILKLNVRDNQAVKKGDVLFEIDPEEYEHGVERAEAALAGLDQQIEAAKAQETELELAVKVAGTGVIRAEAEARQTASTLARLEPLLPKGFVTAEAVEQARTSNRVAESAVETERGRLNQARTAVGALTTLLAQRPGLVAVLKTAQSELSHCKVTAPFDGRVVSLNISEGAHASSLMPIFSLLDTRRWYVMANFREGELRHIAPGMEAEVYVLARPEKPFRGRVQGIGWAVAPEDEVDLFGVPHVKRELNWVHIAQRFPVRIEVENPDPELFRMGASAVATIKGDAR